MTLNLFYNSNKFIKDFYSFFYTFFIGHGSLINMNGFTRHIRNCTLTIGFT